MNQRSVPCLALASLLLSGSGISAQEPVERAASPGRPGLVLLVEGVGGVHLMSLAGSLGFRHAGLPHEVRQFYWSHGLGRIFRDLQDVRHLRAKGEELAGEIKALKANDSSLRIFLVAHSAGTGIAARAAELLPADCLERIVFLSSALSPSYDLRPALRACKGGIVSYNSSLDFVVLGWGTWQFGTADRAYEASAGCDGFQVPPDAGPADQALYGRLVQIAWNPRMIRFGNCGNHNGTVMPAFLSGEVARWLW